MRARCHSTPTLLLITLLAAFAGPLASQTPPPTAPCANLFIILEQEARAASDQMTATLNQAPDLPVTAPPSKQVGAPGSSGTGTSLTSGASFPELVAAALEGGFVKGGDRAVTIDLNLFAFEALVNPQVLDRQTLYGTELNQNLRRFGGTLTFGGQGDAVPDASGQPGTPLTADRLGDIVNWELRYRVLGTRDRRDPTNFRKLSDRTKPFFQPAITLVQQLAVDPDFEQALIPPQNTCYDPEKVKFILHNKPQFKALRKAVSDLDATIEAVNQEIDSSPVWTLVAGGVERRQRFGPNKLTAGLRGAFGDKTRGYTFNLDWSRTDSIGGAARPTTLKAALQYAILIGKLNPLLDKSGLAEPIDIALDGDFEKSQHVPGVAHTTIAKLNLKLELPVMKGVKLPISVTWANHRDLLTNERDIRGNVGFTIDTSQLFKPSS